MSSNSDTHLIVHFGYLKYVLPFDDAVAVLRAMRNAEKISSGTVKGTYVDYVVPYDMDMQLTCVTPAKRLQLHLMGEEIMKENTST